jgi:hypothetical protein
MSDVEINIIPSSQRQSLKLHNVLRIMALGLRRRPRLDARSLPDYLRRDIGLPPADIAIDREISMANVNLRAGMISPRPC